MDRLKFRAVIGTSYFDEEDNEKDVYMTLNDVAVYESGEIGISADSFFRQIDECFYTHKDRDNIKVSFSESADWIDDYWANYTPKDIEQSTGITDSQGRLLFENDIVRDIDDYCCYHVVWNDGSFWITNKGNKIRLCKKTSEHLKRIGSAHIRKNGYSGYVASLESVIVIDDPK